MHDNLDPPIARVIKHSMMQVYNRMQLNIKCIFIDVERVKVDAWRAKNCTRLLGVIFIELMQSGTITREFLAFKSKVKSMVVTTWLIFLWIHSRTFPLLLSLYKP